jgi:hypothetical protein
MRTEFANADLDGLVCQYVKISKDIDNHLNREAARRELRTLVSIGVAILSRPPDIAPGLQNIALERIADACVELQEAIQTGVDALLQRSGYREGIAHDTDGPEANAFALLNRLDPALDSLLTLVSVPSLPARRGAPSDDRRLIFLEECARYFEQWTGKKIAASRGSRFSNFAQALFSAMAISDADDLSWQIKRLIQKRGAKSHKKAI